MAKPTLNDFLKQFKQAHLDREAAEQKKHRDHIDIMLTAFSHMATMDAEDFLTYLVRMWDKVGQEVIDVLITVLRTHPEEDDTIKAMIKLSYRCAGISKMFEAIREQDQDIFEAPEDQINLLLKEMLDRLAMEKKG